MTSFKEVDINTNQNISGHSEINHSRRSYPPLQELGYFNSSPSVTKKYLMGQILKYQICTPFVLKNRSTYTNVILQISFKTRHTDYQYYLGGSLHTPVVRHDLLTENLHNSFTKSVFI